MLFKVTSDGEPELTVVVPVYRNAETLGELHARLRQALESGPEYEIMFVNDASPDNSLSVLSEIVKVNHRVTALSLERNVGQHRAVLIGLSHARGEFVVVMDADLQDPPEAVSALLAKLREGYAAVFAGRRGRYEPKGRLLTSRAFKRLLHLLCGVPADAGMFVAMNRRMVEHLLAFNTAWPFVVAMIGCARLPVASIPVQRAPRVEGQSAYDSWKRLKTGCLAVLSVLVWKWGQGEVPSQRRERRAAVKTYMGARFAPMPQNFGSEQAER